MMVSKDDYPKPKPVRWVRFPVWMCRRCEQEFQGRTSEFPNRCGKCKYLYWYIPPGKLDIGRPEAPKPKPKTPRPRRPR